MQYWVIFVILCNTDTHVILGYIEFVRVIFMNIGDVISDNIGNIEKNGNIW